MVGHEERVELSALERLSEALQVLEVEVRIRVGAGIAPPACMDSHGAHESAEAQLAVGHWNLFISIGKSQPKRRDNERMPRPPLA